jgi:RNA polymerase sigma factor (sigma-70 family)
MWVLPGYTGSVRIQVETRTRSMRAELNLSSAAAAAPSSPDTPDKSTPDLSTRDEGTHDEARLLELLRSGDQAAANEFYDRYAARIYRYIRNLLSSAFDADAEDLLQETFMALAEALPYFRGDSSMFTFACAIAHRKVQSFVRVRARRARLAPDVIAADRDSAPEHHGGGDVKRAMDGLAPEYREVLLLKYVEDQSVAEIAAVLMTSEHTVESRLARARRALRKRLEET